MRTVVLFLFVATVWGADSAFVQKAAELDAALRAKDANQAESLIKELAGKYGDAAPKEQKVAIKSIGKAAAAKDESTRHAAFDALAQLKAPGSSKYLKRWMTPRRKYIASESHMKALQCAGVIADKATLSLLRKLSNHKHTEVAFEATRALGGYKVQPVKTRKKLAMDLVKRLEKLQPGNGSRGYGRSAAESTAEGTEESGTPMGQLASSDPVARNKRLDYGTRLALMQLTGRKYSSVAEWKSWSARAKTSRNPFDT